MPYSHLRKHTSSHFFKIKLYFNGYSNALYALSKEVIDKSLYLLFIVTVGKEAVYLNILISALSQTSIYEQIQSQVKKMVLSGKLNFNEQLPSTRLMAKDLKVNIITVKRAYENLQNEGIIINL